MRRKRLKHSASVLYSMFLGWRLINCEDRIQALGPGRLEIDVLSVDCTFNGQPIESLSIAWELHHWLRNDLASQCIPVDTICSARLEVQLAFSEVGRRDWCTMECRSEIATDETAYIWPTE